MADNEESKSFKVADRRRFDDEGNIKKGTAPEESAESPGQEGAEGKSSGQEVPPGMEITFTSFVMSLATQALMQLGEIQAPPEVQIPVDKVAAKQTIDLLTMLEKKTAGNLDSSEAKLLEEILHSVRVAYVRRT